MATILNTLAEIKTAVDAGRLVYADSEAYTVKKSGTQYLILCSLNNHCIGLHGMEGTQYKTTLNAHQFYIKE